jgi:hypothetical protein
MADVFISYSRLDKDFVVLLREALSAQAQDVWIDWEAIPPSQDWWEEIKKGISKANNFVVILSPHSMSSPMVHQEIEYAAKHNKRILPILYSQYDREECVIALTRKLMHGNNKSVGTPWGSSPVYDVYDANVSILTKLNYFVIGQDDNLDLRINEVINFITSDYDYVQQHTELLLNAQEWQKKGQDENLLLSGNDLRMARLWLENAAGKMPQYLDLQLSYINASHKNETQSVLPKRKRYLFEKVFGPLSSQRKIFISYRRDDSAYATGWIYDRLGAVFGKDNIFLDVDSIDYGVDFSKFIQDTMQKCFAVLVVIGPSWVDILNDRGRKKETDYVKIEIETALSSPNLNVIPLFLRNTYISSSDILPFSMRDLMRKNGTSIRAGRDFHKDMNVLIKELKRLKNAD